jgi:hypothetical protein
MMVAEVLKADYHFTSFHTSQDKGTVEKRIWQGRRFFPKKTDLSNITGDEVSRVQSLLNNIPVKKLIIKRLTKWYSKKLHLLLELTF